MKKYLFTAGKVLLCWVCTLAVCFGLLCAAVAVPADMLRTNLDASADILAVRDPHEFAVHGMYNSVCDNYADAILLGIAANMHDVPSVIDAGYYCDDLGAAVGIKATLAGYEPNTDYSRYWHGSLVFIRPLLAITDISGIRIIGAVVMLLLFALCFVMLYRRSRGAAVIFIVSALLTHIWFVCTTLEYMTVYIIMLSILPLYLRYSDKPSALVVLSCAAGTVTAFADFLTTEIMTLFVPLVAVLLVKRYDDKKSAVLTAGCSVSWLGGYILTFIVRWAAASAVTGRGITDIALSSAGERIGGLPDGIGSHAELFFSSLGANLSMLTLTDSKTDISGTVLWIFIFAAVCIFIGARSNKRRAVPMVLLFIAAVPFVRFGVLMNHSFLHNYFTYRSLMISIMAVLGFVWFKE